MRVVRPDLLPVRDRAGREREDLRRRLVEHRCGRGEARLQLLHDAGVLGVHRLRRRLLEDRAHGRRHQRLGALRHAREQVAHEVRAAAHPRMRGYPAWLPGGAAEDGHDRLPEALVGVGRHELHAGRARATRPRRNASQNASSSLVPTSMPNDAVEIRPDHGRRGAGVLRRSRAGSDGLVVCASGQPGARSVRRVSAMRVRVQGGL